MPAPVHSFFRGGRGESGYLRVAGEPSVIGLGDGFEHGKEFIETFTSVEAKGEYRIRSLPSEDCGTPTPFHVLTAMWWMNFSPARMSRSQTWAKFGSVGVEWRPALPSGVQASVVFRSLG
ncbi:hypothetical protein U6G28_10600 [Actinomycetaceae bacterium MB13-C1-2]|nr:hypothetical protein U6G28_10600 [Actinomycetaceae bacterium MB13-C1-2]